MSFNDYGKPEVIFTEAYFENIQERIKEELRKARETVRICVAWLSSDAFESILKEAVSKGVQVDIVFNDDVINKKNLSRSLGGVNFYPIKTKRHPNLMHNKFCIIDESTVITGSYNWSKRAGQHFENIIIVRNDYALVEKFMHEFYDLVNHFSDAHDLFKVACKKSGCKSESYNLGVLGSESGLYDESTLAVWNVCCTHGHITFLKEAHAIHLRMMLGLKDADDFDDELYPLDKPDMLRRFHRARNDMKAMQDVFTNHLGVVTHAVGYIYVTNDHQHLEWGEPQEFAISMLWRHMYYRKLIPEVIIDDHENFDISRIVDRHYY
ncbi:phospholipase D-like domain-containing protein [Pseudomonas asiatica]|uniref:phospholipase D-like domain-containing protein n=1 Tax=Pseudomonas asiatica TaxID=2219225 RepID=UPI0025A091D5|nr:phospholipase D-like domain-containing protein [Pseudomonas asiatica]WJM52582.1 phospholipase D-like domain-containing protein [Pseudomonas asiatica]